MISNNNFGTFVSLIPKFNLVLYINEKVVLFNLKLPAKREQVAPETFFGRPSTMPRSKPVMVVSPSGVRITCFCRSS